ncbi:hypothetical protein CCMSSC00406_0002777 [Pleurotus cornucopiae]|uniref:Uncharacterized protein n=1 Tax=Pleurotus cornucopiae TaxID=5321 RepID=A0ACB7IW28_PLECO|nr:hypothetical protein CCMSSC00406_0002777 [Pleurotus cornucopiae]
MLRDTDGSDDEGYQDPQPGSRKRSSRACDQCRKTKSKCERPDGEALPCKSCLASGTACTFLGPSYKRGPPKGYIHAIEQRWHQVECLIGALLQCNDPRVQSVIQDLRRDNLASAILDRVDTGPYGPSGRQHTTQKSTKEDFFATIMKSSQGSGGDASRTRRQSRVSREIVSSTQDHDLSVVPTLDWQDKLALRLGSTHPHPDAYGSPVSPGASLDTYGVPHSQRRRLDEGTLDIMAQQAQSPMSTQESTSSYEPTDAMGQLSLDEDQELRYHGKASGLHLLSRTDRTDNRNEGGIWKMPMARMWPPSQNANLYFGHEEDVDVRLPPIEVQDRLIELYFTYIHPLFPVLHRIRFMEEYELNKHILLETSRNSPSSTTNPTKPDFSQKVSKLLLLAIFAISARFTCDRNQTTARGVMWEEGCEYLDSARKILNQVYHRSRSPTVQALLLLGYREFGIGSMEQAWIFLGMGIRMATDLGLNCDSGKWRRNGRDLLTPEETQTRRHIWWTCCLADVYGSVYMGRPVAIHASDYDVPLPDVDEAEDRIIWEPPQFEVIKPNIPPCPGFYSDCFLANATLSVIVGDLIGQVYPVRTGPQMDAHSGLEARLAQWYLQLPQPLRYDPSNKRITQPPHIITLHVRYWGAVLLLQRAFIPNWSTYGVLSRRADSMRADLRTSTGPDMHSSTQELKAFDLAQSAASHISTIITSFRETFTMKRTSPFLTSYLLNAGVMHILTLTLRSSNPQATLGLQQCLSALEDMAIVWPSASRAWDLLNNVKLGFDKVHTMPPQNMARNKRLAEDAFAQESTPEAPSSFDPAAVNGVQDLNMRIMAHMLGLDIPGIEASTSFYPGYEWWPRTNEAMPPGAGPSTNDVGNQAIAYPHNVPQPQNTPSTGWLMNDTENPPYRFYPGL